MNARALQALTLDHSSDLCPRNIAIGIWKSNTRRTIRRTFVSSDCWIEFSDPCQLSEVDALCLVSAIGGHIAGKRGAYEFFEGITLVALLLE